MIAQVLKTQKWNTSHAGTDQRSSTVSGVQFIYFPILGQMVKGCKWECVQSGPFRTSSYLLAVLRVLFSETDFLHRPVMFHSHSWIQWRKNNTSNDLPFLKRNHHSSWIFCAPHIALWAFLRGLLSNYSLLSSTCLAHEIWKNHSLMWSSWDLSFIY